MSAPQTRDVIVGIDAGTSLIKTVAFTREGRQLGSFSLPNVYRAARPPYRPRCAALRRACQICKRASRRLPSQGRATAHG